MESEDALLKTQTPFYKEVDGVLLIGTTHTQMYDGDAGFLEKIAGKHALALEGHPWDYGSHLLPTYENTAFLHHKGDVIYLDDGVDMFEVGRKYGIRTSYGGFYGLCAALPLLMNQAVSAEMDGDQFVGSLVWYLEEVHSKWPYVNVPATLERFQMAAGEFGIQELVHMGTQMTRYLFREVREYEVFCPRVKEMVADASGPYAVITGLLHVPVIEAELSTGL